MLTSKPTPVKKKKDSDTSGTREIIQINETGQVTVYVLSKEETPT